jgi:hypothetical protein
LIRFLFMLHEVPRAFPGFTLVAPMLSTTTYLIDMQGRPVRTWESDYNAGEAAYLLEDGHLLRAGQLTREERLFAGPAAGGRLQEFTWEGELVWDFKFHNEKQVHHHDFTKLPNGNVLLLVWEIKTAEETIAAGRKPELVDGPWLVDSVIEIKPTGKTTGEVVWEWHAWDHLIQDHDPSRANYGDVAAHPELIDINFGHTLVSEFTAATASPREDAKRKSDLNTLRSIGYLGAPAARGMPETIPDWTHVNAVAYNAELDQVMLSVRAFSELWIIDHGTTTAEAKGHTGGRGRKGGDLLYRWGNPQACRAGTEADQRLFAQHDAHWIPRGRPGAGHVLVFNNGKGRPGDAYSSVDEIVLPVDAEGRYRHEPTTAYGPSEPIWRFTAPWKAEFFVGFLSGAQRLPNGNTLICDGMSGTIFEATRDNKVVWTYVHKEPTEPGSGGFRPPAGGPGSQPRRGELLASSLRDMLKVSPEQKRELDELQNEVDDQLTEVLTAEQLQRLGERSGPGPGGFGGFALPGQIMSLSTQIALKPTDKQKKALAELQKQVDDKLASMLTADQKDQFKAMKDRFGRGTPPGFGAGGPPGTGPGRPGGAPGFGIGDTGGWGGFRAPPGVYPVFRARRYGADYAGLAGKDLRLVKTVEQRPAKEPRKS